MHSPLCTHYISLAKYFINGIHRIIIWMYIWSACFVNFDFLAQNQHFIADIDLEMAKKRKL